MTDTQTTALPVWVEHSVIRNEIYVIPDAMKVARIIAVLRAAYLDSDTSCKVLYDAALAHIVSNHGALLDEAKRAIAAALAGNRKEAELRQRIFVAKYGCSFDSTDIIGALPPPAHQLVKEILNDLDVGRMVLCELLYLDAIKFDIRNLDHMRARRSNLYNLIYPEGRTTRFRRRHGPRARELLAKRWELYNDVVTLDAAKVWVRVRLVERSATKWLIKQDVTPEYPDWPAMQSLSRKLEPIDRALETRRKGRPPKV